MIPTELLTRAIQPALWLLIFGEVFTRIRAIPTGDLRYLDFLAPGVLAQSVLFIAIFYGIAVIWERDLGLVHKLLVSPGAARGAGAGQGAFGGRARAFAGVHRLSAGVAAGREDELASAGAGGGGASRCSWARRSFRPFP